MTAPQARFRASTFSGYATGVLDLNVAGRRVLSVPTQLGCTVGCTFCISRTRPLVRNLRADEILALVEQCFAEEPPDGRPVEVSFTGEGEPLLNWKQADIAVRQLAQHRSITGVRYCLSGLGADKLLERVDTRILPTRLQVSLHAARQPVRDRLVPRSLPLSALESVLLAHAARFASVELNVVLQDGVNDSAEDLAALTAWGARSWPILLNPVMTEASATAGTQTSAFAQSLRAAGREVRVYAGLAAEIVQKGHYSQLTAQPVQLLRGAVKRAELDKVPNNSPVI